MCKDNFIPLTFKLHRSTSHYVNTKTDICNVKKNSYIIQNLVAFNNKCRQMTSFKITLTFVCR